MVFCAEKINHDKPVFGEIRYNEIWCSHIAHTYAHNMLRLAGLTRRLSEMEDFPEGAVQ